MNVSYSFSVKNLNCFFRYFPDIFLKIRFLSAFCLVLLYGTAFSQSYTVTTSPPLAQNNGNGGITFNVHAKATIKVTDVLVTLVTGNQNWEVWYNKDSVNGSPTISSTNGWILHETGLSTGNNNTPVKLNMVNPITIQAGETYGFFIGKNNLRYHTRVSSDKVFYQDGNMYIYLGNNVGYGGASPTIANRLFCGGITYELVANLPPVAGFSAPDTLYTNSNYTFRNHTAPGSATHEWYINGNLVSKAQDLDFSSPVTGQITVKLKSTNLLGSDSITRTLTIAKPWRTPLPNFAADKNKVEVFEKVKLFNLSEYGFSSTQWKISPEEFLDPLTGFYTATYYYAGTSTEYSTNPEILFQAPGNYKICLVTGNDIGYDSICMDNYIRVLPTFEICNSGNVTYEPEGVLYDNGGPDDDYWTNSECSFLISSCGASVILNLTELDLSNGDYLRIYDGKDNNGKPLWNTTDLPFGMNGKLSDPGISPKYFSATGYFYLEFSTGTAGSGKGFRAEWKASDLGTPAPKANFAVPGSICANTLGTFINTTDGEFLQNKWYVNGTESGKDFNLELKFPSSGTYDVKLVTKNCGGADSITKKVVVTDPNDVPKPGFMANNMSPGTNDIVSFTDTTGFCTDKWLWEISPKTFEYVDGTGKDHPNPKVKFKTAGCYTVSLTLKRGDSTETESRSCYINVVNYCDPSIVNMNQDIGISKVEILDFSNSSTSGESYYSNYTGNGNIFLIPGATFDITLSRPTNLNKVNWAVWIDYDNDGKFGTSERVAGADSNMDKSWTGTFTVPSSIQITGTRMRVAAGHADNPVYSCGPLYFGEFEDYQIFFKNDDLPPVITLTGNDTILVESGNPYSEPGYYAFDNVDGNLTSAVIVTGTVNTQIPGEYFLTYSVSDLSGNSTSVKRLVKVSVDITPPVLTLMGPLADTLAVFEAWSEPGYSAIDARDGNITSSVVFTGMVDPSVTGEYTINYSVTDAAGNKATASRKIWVVDTVAPVITLIGGSYIYYEAPDVFLDPGYVVTDNYDTMLNVEIKGVYYPSLLGIVYLEYCVEDNSGNSYCITRVVETGDTTSPVVTLKSNDTLFLEANEQFFDPGLEITDNYWGTFSIIEAGTFPGTTDTVGFFTIDYQVTDGSGNTTQITRYLDIRDTEAPFITLLGKQVDTVLRWRTYNDPGVDVTDNYAVNPKIIVGGDFVDAQLIGTYFRTYEAVDRFGNNSEKVTRIIHVIPNTGIREGSGDRKVSIYPNPNTGIFEVIADFPEEGLISMSLLNMQGKELITPVNILSGTPRIVNTGDLPGGVYFISITTQNDRIIKKIIISK